MALLQKDYGTEKQAIKFSTERHVACVLLLDTSGSMENDNAIKKLNEGIKAVKEEILTYDDETKACIDIAIVTFDSDVSVIQNFKPAEDTAIPELVANGTTHMGEALNVALDMIDERKAYYNQYGTPYFRPWIFLITDGEPTDEYKEAAERLKNAEAGCHVLGYCVGVDGYNKSRMAEIFDKGRMYDLSERDFKSAFLFLSNSMAAIRNSTEKQGVVEIKKPDTLNIAY